MKESPKKNKFEAGEKVLCYHGPMLYKAKCLEYRVTSNGLEYYVHYDGWNKSWDEWVPESRVEKSTTASITAMANLQKTLNTQKSFKGKNKTKSKQTSTKEDSLSCDPDSRSSTPVADSKKKTRGDKRRGSPTPSNESGSDAPKRIKTEHVVESKQQFLDRAEVKINMPVELKKWLAHENFWILKKKKLLNFPVKTTADNVLDMYVESKKSIGRNQNEMLANHNIASIACDGIKEYFNAMLATRLLYAEEKSQYTKLKTDNPSCKPSEIYGCQHLVRLFVKLDEALAYARLGEKGASYTSEAFCDFLQYLATNLTLFLDRNDYK